MQQSVSKNALQGSSSCPWGLWSCIFKLRITASTQNRPWYLVNWVLDIMAMLPAFRFSFSTAQQILYWVVGTDLNCQLSLKHEHVIKNGILKKTEHRHVS